MHALALNSYGARRHFTVRDLADLFANALGMVLINIVDLIVRKLIVLCYCR